MMHLLRKYDVAPVGRNDAMFAQCAVRHTSLGAAVITRRSQHHLPQANIIQKRTFVLVDKGAFFVAKERPKGA